MAANSCELFRSESEPLDTLRSLFQAHPLTQRSLVLSAAQVNTTATPGDVLRAAAKPGLAIEL